MKNLSLALALISTVSMAAPKEIWSIKEGLKNPESVIYDSTSKSYFVSNVNGEGNAKDSNGFISQTDENGVIKKIDWVSGLSAPKGLAVQGNTLWVSDIDALVEIDISAGKIVKRIPAEGALFLNDVAATKDGLVFVSDTMSNQIYKYDGKTLSSLSKTEDFDSPNGLFVDNDHLVLASWGLTKSFNEKPKKSGKLYTLSFDGTKKKAFTKSIGNLDGLEKVGNDFIVSDWMNGKIQQVTAKGKAKTIYQGKQGTADITLRKLESGKTLLVIPQMVESSVTAFEL